MSRQDVAARYTSAADAGDFAPMLMLVGYSPEVIQVGLPHR
ncbi:hypothetical protein [Luteimonas sp. 100069]|nr:hypothetical protein [Luteimonas sp. 100069]